MWRLTAALAVALTLMLILALAGDAAMPVPAADPDETGTQNCNRCPAPTCGNACFWPECTRCSRCCVSRGEDGCTRWRDYAPCRSWRWHTRGYNLCRGGTVHIGEFRMANYGAALDRAGNSIGERTLCRNRNSGWVGREPLATAIPAGREYLYLTPTPVPAVRRPSGAWNTPKPVGLATAQAPVTRISGRTPVPTAADPTARARFRQQAGRGCRPGADPTARRG